MPFLDKLLQRIDRIEPRRLEHIFRALAKERDLLEKIFNLLIEGIIVTDRTGRISYVNRRASRLLKNSGGGYAGERAADMIKEPALSQVVNDCLSSRKRLLEHELDLNEPEGTTVIINVVPLEDEDGKYDGSVIIVRDVTAERHQQSRMAQIRRIKALAILAAGIAHELGNPLNSLGIHLQLLARKISSLKSAPERSEFYELISIAREEVNRLEHIISQFLKAIRPERSEMEDGNIITVLDKTLEFFRPEIESRGIILEKEYENTIPPVNFNRETIRQVFINLIKNAIQAMPRGGKLKAKAACGRGVVSISFTDTGAGISKSNLDKIFEPYFTTKDEGAGLGLMIVQRILSEHNGTMDVKSTPGKGSTMIVSIPVPRKYRRLLPSYSDIGSGDDGC
jgi:PAS domain S-box-containing protein